MSTNRYIFLVVFLFVRFIAFCQTGPGGVGSNDGSSHLVYWIDANSGRTGTNPVSAIADLSGNNVINLINGNPTFVSGTLNTFGAIRFDGVGDEIATNLSINAITYPDLTVFAVYVPRIVFSGSVWGEDNGEWDRYLTDINLVPTLNASVGSGNDPGDAAHPCVTIDNLFNPGMPTLTNVIYREDEPDATVVRVNGGTASFFTSDASNYQFTQYSNFYVGAIGSNGFRFDGDIAEVIVFNTALTDVEQRILENSLSAKYGIPIADADFDLYQQDDLGFDFDVAGIGRTDGVSHDDSRGTGTVRIWAPSDLDDDEFLMWGHNGEDVQAMNTDVPANVAVRSERFWAASELDLSGGAVDVGSVSVSFTLAGLGNVVTADLRLLIDTDADGTFADETPIAGATSLGNNEYVFHNVTGIADGTRFTYATANNVQTPLPVELSALKANISGDKSKVTLSWTTLSEKNNDRFEILRSDERTHWQQVGEVKGSGNSNVALFYSFTDFNPRVEDSYYRICQIDFDGKRKFSEVVMVPQHRISSLHFFPNPANDGVVVTGSELLMTPIYVYSLLGENFTDHVKITIFSDSAIELDVTSLPEGGYIVVSLYGKGRFMKMLDCPQIK